MAAEEREHHDKDEETGAGIAGAGAAGGAIAGATIGSVAGPIGTAAGAIGGAVVGGIAAGVAAQGQDHAPSAEQELPQTRSSAAPRDPLPAGKPPRAGDRAGD